MTAPPPSSNTGGSASPSFRPAVYRSTAVAAHHYCTLCMSALDQQPAQAALQQWVTPTQQWTLAATKEDADASTRPQQSGNGPLASQFSRVLYINPLSRSQQQQQPSAPPANTIQSPLYLVSTQPPLVNFVLHKHSALSIANFVGDMKIYGSKRSEQSSNGSSSSAQYGRIVGRIVSFQSTGDSLTVLATIDELVVPASDNASHTHKYTYGAATDGSNDPAVLSLAGTPTNSTPEPAAPKKRIRLNAFTMGCVGHQAPGLWTHPDDEAEKYTSLEYWVELAQLLERGGFDGVFLADVLGVYDVYGGNRDAALRNGTQIPLIDPVLPISAMAAATKRLGFGATVSLTYELPYKFARTMSTLDHITKGRVAWNIVTSYLQSAAINLGLDTQIPHDERYNIADEFLDVCYKLWEGSWEDDAVVKDKQKRIFTHPHKVHDINHEGIYYKVPGAHLCEPSPQRTPFLFQAGASSRGSQFAAKHAEAIFIADVSIAATAKHVKAVRQQISEQGRDGDAVVIYSMCTVVVGDTDEDAQRRWDEYKSYASLEGALALFGGWTGVDLSGLGPDEPLKHIETDANKSALAMFTKDPTKTWTPRMVANHIALGGRGPKVWGSVKSVCDQLERWVDEGGIDGFNLTYVTSPHSYREFVDKIVPELRRRGRLPSQIEDSEEFDGLTLRQRMGHKSALIDDTHPAAEYRRLRQQYSKQTN